MLDWCGAEERGDVSVCVCVGGRGLGRLKKRGAVELHLEKGGREWKMGKK